MSTIFPFMTLFANAGKTRAKIDPENGCIYNK